MLVSAERSAAPVVEAESWGESRMATRRKTGTRKPVPKAPALDGKQPSLAVEPPAQVQDFLRRPLGSIDSSNPKPLSLLDLRRRTNEFSLRPTVPLEKLLISVNRIKPPLLPLHKAPEEITGSLLALKPLAGAEASGHALPLWSSVAESSRWHPAHVGKSATLSSWAIRAPLRQWHADAEEPRSPGERQ